LSYNVVKLNNTGVYKMSETRTINSQDARAGLKKCFDKKRPVFLWGPPGIGKSELVADIAQEMEGHMIDLTFRANGSNRHSWYSLL